MKILGLLIQFIALLFAIIETAYFGWNWCAKSDSELICDIIAIVIWIIGYGIYKIYSKK